MSEKINLRKDPHNVLEDKRHAFPVTPLEEILDGEVIPDEAEVIEAPRMTLRADPENCECNLCGVPFI